MAGCHTDGSIFNTVLRFGGANTSNHCECRTPADPDRAKILDYQVYPALSYDSANINQKPRPAVMYPSTVRSLTTRGGTPTYYNPYSNYSEESTAACGKDIKSFGGFDATFEYRPDGLSFNIMESDTWFAYIFEMGADGGTVGIPCYRIIRQQRSGTPAGQTVPPGGTPTTTTELSTRCIPCENFYCTPVESFCNYTSPGGNETGDPDAPYPLIFGIGTTSKKVVFKYEALSTELPNGVIDLNFVYAPDGIDQDAWNAESYSGDPIITTQNPWIYDEDQLFSTIQIYEGTIFESGNKQDLKVKVKISPVIDFTQNPPVTTGTEWELLELMQSGLNYAVNDTFTLSYTHTHDDQTTDTISIDMKVTAVGPYTAPGSSAGFDILRAGDTINGHVVTETFHTDLDNFIYHVLYVDGDGADFVKDTQYTSDRNHVITVVAGYGIPDRSALIGLYEFMNKSIQFVTLSVDPVAPDIYNTVLQPDITPNIANGQLESVTINYGGEGWDTIGHKPRLVITPPDNPSGKSAEIEAVFTGGEVTAVKIISRGSGYSTSNPPQIHMRDVYQKETVQLNAGIDQDAAGTDPWQEAVRNAGTFPEYINRLDTDSAVKASENLRRDAYKPQSITVEKNNSELITDPDQDTRLPLPQRLYSKEKVDLLRSTYDTYDFTPPAGAPVNEEYRKAAKIQTDTLNSEIDNHFDKLTQKQIPDFAKYPATKIETTMRRFAELPRASQYTKYLINQYRADTQKEVTISISIGCNVAESGCEHIEDECPAPGLPASTTNDEEETYTDENNIEQTETVTYSYSYLLSPLLGPGCENWSASGSMTILNNLTKSANTYAAAVAAFGNPFDI